MLLKEIVDTILNDDSGGKASDDGNLAEEQIAFMVHNTRATILTDHLNKKGVNPTQIICLPIPCLEFILVSSTEGCGVDLGCKILRSRLQVPAAIVTNSGELVGPLYTLDGSCIIPKTDKARSTFDSHLPFIGNRKRWFIKNNYVYLLNDLDSRFLMLDIVPENPMDLAKFNGIAEACGCKDASNVCFDWTTQDYPVSAKHAEIIIERVKAQLRPRHGLPLDEHNDNKERHVPKVSSEALNRT